MTQFLHFKTQNTATRQTPITADQANSDFGHNVRCDEPCKRVNRHHPEIFVATGAHSHMTSRLLFVAHDQNIRKLL